MENRSHVLIKSKEQWFRLKHIISHESHSWKERINEPDFASDDYTTVLQN